MTDEIISQWHKDQGDCVICEMAFVGCLNEVLDSGGWLLVCVVGCCALCLDHDRLDGAFDVVVDLSGFPPQ